MPIDMIQYMEECKEVMTQDTIDATVQSVNASRDGSISWVDAVVVNHCVINESIGNEDSSITPFTKNKIREAQKEDQSISNSLQKEQPETFPNATSRYPQQNLNMDSIIEKLNKIRTDTTELKASQVLGKNDELKERVGGLEQEVPDLNQYHSRVNLEVSGISETLNGEENTDSTVLNILQKIEPEITANEIDITHRIGTRKSGTMATRSEERQQPRPRHIIVRFTTRRRRNSIYDKRRKLISTRDLGYEQNNNIYINENLTPAGRSLLGKTNAAKKRTGYKFMWTYNGRIYVKKSPDHNTIIINTEPTS
uniref:Uncharacterized protein LOC102805302 n=1 Tax=Saccoglossus kowalevskii TaxID=10224 RepID=A0ABM0MYG9_SACKO